MRGEERPLLLREEAAQRTAAGHDGAHVGLRRRPFHRRRADEPTGHRVDLHPEARRPAQLRRQLVWDDRPQLHDGVVALALDPPCANDDAVRAQLQIGRVEEEDLADLRLERVDAERCHRRLLMGLRDGELQLDAVGTLHQAEDLGDLCVRESLPRGRPGRHPTHRTTAPPFVASGSWNTRGMRDVLAISALIGLVTIVVWIVLLLWAAREDGRDQERRDREFPRS